MLLRYTFQYPRRQSSAELRGQILDLSKRYVKALAEENKNLMNGGGGASMAGYGKREKKMLVTQMSFFPENYRVTLFSFLK